MKSKRKTLHVQEMESNPRKRQRIDEWVSDVDPKNEPTVPESFINDSLSSLEDSQEDSPLTSASQQSQDDEYDEWNETKIFLIAQLKDVCKT